MKKKTVRSRLQGFYKLPIAARQGTLARAAGVDPGAFARLAKNGGMTLELADHMVENVVATYGLPMGVALNFTINGEDMLLPMVIEEPSVVAAASNAARLVRGGGGFHAESDPPHMISQVQLLDVPDAGQAVQRIRQAGDDVLRACAEAQPGLVRRGGGPREVEVRVLDRSTLVVHLIVDCVDAMGANAVNTVAEQVAPLLATLSGGRAGLRILSNLADRRCVRVRCRIPADALAIEQQGWSASGEEVRDGIVEASRFAERDPYRAATHNKGIMNGADAVALATGQDWRGIEAGAHAFAAQSGRYAPLAVWRCDEAGGLTGALEMPMAVGTVGGAVAIHPGAGLAMDLLGRPNAERLGQVIAAAGLATNLAAIRALATEGIQRGHMNLHRRRVDFSSGWR
jgi:hydroxymethylglutaryl-CoA reductase